MVNMEHCRFENTLEALRECQESMDDRDLSPEEKRARRELIDVCWRIAKDYGDEGDDEEYNEPPRSNDAEDRYNRGW